VTESWSRVTASPLDPSGASRTPNDPSPQNSAGRIGVDVKWTKLSCKVRNQRLDAAHQLSRRLVNHYDLIVVEDLQINNMVRAAKAKPNPARPGAFLPTGAATKGGLNRSIHDAGWGRSSRC
jgi:putative transposase